MVPANVRVKRARSPLHIAWFLVATAVLACVASPVRAQSPDPAPSQDDAAPTIRDEDNYWDNGDRALMNKMIAGLFRRYRCRVVIESYPKARNDWADGADLNDKDAVDRAIRAVRDRRVRDVQALGNSDPYAVVILGPGRFVFAARFSNLSAEEMERVVAGFRERVTGNDTYVAPGSPTC